LLRCEIAEDPKGNRRRRSMRRMPRELASGSSEKWRRPVSTGVCIPGSGPAADIDDRSTDRPSQCIMRTILRTKSRLQPKSSRQEDMRCQSLCRGTAGERWRPLELHICGPHRICPAAAIKTGQLSRRGLQRHSSCLIGLPMAQALRIINSRSARLAAEGAVLCPTPD
jgi:hypothetical protein